MSADVGPPTLGDASGGSAHRLRKGRRVVRQVIIPVLSIALIAAIIWWIENRQSSAGISDSGTPYGVIDLPLDLRSADLAVGAEQGKLAPDFLLEDLDGGEIRLSELRGNAVVINFWATWCKPCRKEVPQLIEAYNAYRNQGLVILGVNLQESESIIRPFVEDFGMNFPIPIDRTGSVTDRYRVLGVPTTYFVDRQGVVSSVFTGPFEEKIEGTNVQAAIEQNELLKRIEEILD